ncbi:MAG: putative metal-binding motif-containing protein [Myxococcota bacterium]
MIATLLLACGGPPDPKPDTSATETDSDTQADADTDADADADTDTDTPPDPDDLDGDGHDALDAGGDDCDDENAWTFPGATEYCDTVDQDCDGDPMAEGACGGATPLGAAGWELAYSSVAGLEAGLVGDLTGDGVSDVVHTRGWAGDLLVYAGGALPDEPYVDAEGDAVWHDMATSGAYLYQFDGGDLDGDGADDLLLLESTGYGVIAHYGPLNGPGGRSDWLSDVDARWVDYYEPGYSAVVVSGVDFDSDGRADFAIGSWTAEGDSAYELYFGGEPPDRCAMRSDGGAAGGTAATPIGDGDGDGLVDLSWRVGGEVQVVAGELIREVCQVPVEDVAAGWILAGDSLAPYPIAHLGDWTGDGVDEWVAFDDTSEGEDGVWIFSATQGMAGEFSVDDALGSYVVPPDRFNLGVPIALDFDGDDLRELVVAPETCVQMVHGGQMPGPHDDLPDNAWRLDCGYAWLQPSAGDFDADGRADLLVVEGDRDDNTWRLAWLVPGFDVPWDDPFYW